MADNLAERLKSRTERELDALGEGMASKPARPKRISETKPVQSERRGVGRDLVDETTKALLKGMDARIAAAKKAGNAKMVAELQARRKALLSQ